MTTTREEVLTCVWCARSFVRSRVGRRPIYCRPTCRQRSYEDRRRCGHRAGFPVPEGHSASAPRALGGGLVPVGSPPARPAYEGGAVNGRWHALRPESPTDARGQRLTLCGARARRIRRPFDAVSSRRPGPDIRPPCATCIHLATSHPAPRCIDASADLALVTAAVARCRAFGASAAAAADEARARDEPWTPFGTRAPVGPGEGPAPFRALDHRPLHERARDRWARDERAQDQRALEELATDLVAALFPGCAPGAATVRTHEI
jgi:hypothetical protein